MLKILIIISLSLNLAFANSRFSDDDKKKFMEDVKQEITVHKMENKGVVDLQIIKPSFYEGLDSYNKQEKLTNGEVVRVKQRYEDFSKSRSVTPANSEESFYKFVEDQLNEINKTQVSKIQEGQVCNNWTCENGLKCAVDPRQEDGKSCKKEGKECRENVDCCSSSCSLNKNTKKKTCEDVYTCFKPLTLGQSCLLNPVCGEGECLAYNSKTSGIGECVDNGRACKNNLDCCSNSCNQNKCIDSFVCKDCVKNGKKSDRGQKCCEGLYMKENGVCAPDVPPIVFPQVNYKFHILHFMTSLVLNKADAAQTTQEIAAQMAEILKVKLTGVAATDEAAVTAALGTFGGTDLEETQLKNLAYQDPILKAAYDKEAAARAAEEQASADKDKKATAANLAISSQSGNLNMTDEITNNKAKYENFAATSIKEKVDVKNFKVPEMKFTRKTKMETCEIYFRDDFANYLKTSNLLNLELALLSFDYVFLGDGINDYWMKSNDPKSSIYGRLKKIAEAHQATRKDTNKKMDAINDKLTCMCIDSVGYDNFKGANEAQTIEKKKFFNDKCPESTASKDGEVCSRLISCTAAEQGTSTCNKDNQMPESCAKGAAGCTCTGTTIASIEGETASGVKGKRLIVEQTQQLELFNDSLAVDNTKIYTDISNVSTWAADAKWNEAENIKYSLFNFNLKKPNGSVAAMGAILFAFLAAGVIAVLGGFATTSILSAWFTAGIIATSAITGGTGLWLIASLKGAWITKRPEVKDGNMRSYKCGKKETCEEWSRELNQPFNNICNVHTSANACVKNFVVYDEAGEYRYLVDPWIPKGVNKNLILRDLSDSRNYAEKMEDGFQTAKSFMLSKDPHSPVNGPFVAEEYMKTIFIDAIVLGKYTPKIGLDDKRYILNSSIVEEIKSKARAFAIEERFFQAEDTENLNNFSDYTYQYHFIWPKTSRQKEISYPTIGLTTYLDLMSNGVAANMAVGATNAAKTFGNLNSNYLQDYLNTLKLYSDLPSNQSDAGKMALINAEIAKTQAELDNKKAFNAIMNNTGLDSQLLNLSQGANPLSKINGGTGNLVLTSGQAQLLNAIGTLRLGRINQLKKLDAFKRAIAKNNNPERALKVSAISKKFAASFAKPLSKSSFGAGSSGLVGSGGTEGALTDSLNKSDNASKGNNDSGGAGYDSGNTGSYGGSHSTSPGASAGANNNDSAKDGNASITPRDEDGRNLSDAIEARNRLSKKQYQSSEDLTIFEQVTNAYIRNYDKVLIRKSEQDVPARKK